MKEGRIIEEHRVSYVVLIENKEYVAHVRGSFFDSKTFPKVGDMVLCSATSKDKYTIEEVLPRKSSIIRRDVETDDEQILVTNVDYIFIVMALDGDFNINRLERYLLLAKESKVKPVIVLNKIDTVADRKEYIKKVTAVSKNVDIIPISAKKKENLDALLPYFKNNATIVLLGSSGAGKSTITNWLLQKDVQQTSHVRQDDSRGRHTTTRRQLFTLPRGGFLIDTPGIRELGIKNSVKTDEEEVFQKIHQIAKDCQFKNCDHKKSNGCAVVEAIARGTITERQLKNMQKIESERLTMGQKQYTLLDKENKKQRKKNLKKILSSKYKNKLENDF